MSVPDITDTISEAFDAITADYGAELPAGPLCFRVADINGEYFPITKLQALTSLRTFPDKVYAIASEGDVCVKYTLTPLIGIRVPSDRGLRRYAVESEWHFHGREHPVRRHMLFRPPVPILNPLIPSGPRTTQVLPFPGPQAEPGRH